MEGRLCRHPNAHADPGILGLTPPPPEKHIDPGTLGLTPPPLEKHADPGTLGLTPPPLEKHADPGTLEKKEAVVVLVAGDSLHDGGAESPGEGLPGPKGRQSSSPRGVGQSWLCGRTTGRPPSRSGLRAPKDRQGRVEFVLKPTRHQIGGRRGATLSRGEFS